MTDTAKATARRGVCPRCRHAGPQHTAPGRCLHCTDRRCDWWPVSAYEYDALKAVEAAARAFDTHELFFTTLEGTTYCMVCNGTDGDHVSIIFGNDRRPCPVPGFLDALAALDAIRKQENAR